MSQTALAVIHTDNLNAYGIEQDSTLAQMLLGEVAGPVDIDEAFFMDADTASDFDGIIPDVPRLRLNAKDGKFVSSKEEDPAKAVSSITGVMLCRDSNNIFFGFKKNQKERVALCKEHGLKLLVDVDGGYICRGLSNGSAQLNPQLTAEQADEAKKLGFGGATGGGCLRCPMGQWIKTSDGNKRMCADSENLVWLDSQLGEPFVLGIIAGNTIARLRKWIAAAFQYRGKKMNLFAYAVQLAFTGEKDENDNNVLQMKLLGQLSNDQAKMMRSVREGYKHMLERAALANAYEGHADETKADAENAEPSPSDLDAPVDDMDLI